MSSDLPENHNDESLAPVHNSAIDIDDGDEIIAGNATNATASEPTEMPEVDSDNTQADVSNSVANGPTIEPTAAAGSMEITLPPTSVELDFSDPITPAVSGDDDYIDFADVSDNEGAPKAPINFDKTTRYRQLKPPKVGKGSTVNEITYTLVIPNDGYSKVELDASEKAFKEQLGNLLKAGKITAREESTLWSGYLQSTKDSRDFIYSEGEFNGLADREGSNWVGGVPTEKGEITLSYPKIKLADGGDRLEGLAAIQYLFKSSGLGAPVHAPFFDSGIRLHINLFSEVALLNLSRALTSKRIELGRTTNGATWTADDVVLNGIICEAILDNVIASNVTLTGNKTLADYLTVFDIPILENAALAAIYPNGYPVYHMCINTSKGKCDYTLNPKRKAWAEFEPDSLLLHVNSYHVDLNSLPLSAIRHMSTRPAGQYSDADLVKYKDDLQQHLSGRESTYTTTLGDDKLVFHFKVPTMREYFDNGREWIRHLETMTEAILKKESFVDEEQKEARRTEVVIGFYDILNLLKYIPWLKMIVLEPGNGDVPKIMSDKKTLEGVLEMMWNQGEFIQSFIAAVDKFKVNMMTSFIGVNNFVCPKCHSEQHEPDAKYPWVIPINVASHFFTLMELRNQYHRLDL